ncbi:MAG: TNT domain-containing protein [Lachnospiraceae bacterium]|nr:TNT domain-containing protein [Lachnospiraceae bacterium]
MLKNNPETGYATVKVDVDPALDACLGLYDYYFTPYVSLGLAEAYSPEDEAFVSGWGENRPSDKLWAEYEDVYRNPKYYDSADGDIIWPANDGFYGESFDYTLLPYTQIDRYGSDYGTFASLVGHPYPDYSLAPGSKYKNYSVFIVRKPIQVKAGSVYPWFDEPGKATQVVLPSPVKDLLADGSLERIVYR